MLTARWAYATPIRVDTGKSGGMRRALLAGLGDVCFVAHAPPDEPRRQRGLLRRRLPCTPASSIGTVFYARGPGLYSMVGETPERVQKGTSNAADTGRYIAT